MSQQERQDLWWLPVKMQEAFLSTPSLSTLSCTSPWNDFSYSKELEPHVRAGVTPILFSTVTPTHTWHSFKWVWVTCDGGLGSRPVVRFIYCTSQASKLGRRLSWYICQSDVRLRIIMGLLPRSLFSLLLCFPFTCSPTYPNALLRVTNRDYFQQSLSLLPATLVTFRTPTSNCSQLWGVL